MRLVGISCGERGDEVFLRSYYLRQLNRLGMCGVALPPQDLADKAVEEVIGRLDGLILSGGGDLHPKLWGEQPRYGLGEVDCRRDCWELALVGAAYAADLPLLGICRGMQVMNVWGGGSLWQDLREMPQGLLHKQSAPAKQPWHEVKLSGRLAEICGVAEGGTAEVNSFHHQGVRWTGEGVTACAWAPDGLVEGIMLAERRFAVGVQWHPERLGGAEKLWEAFAAACGV